MVKTLKTIFTYLAIFQGEKLLAVSKVARAICGDGKEGPYNI